VAQFKKGDRVQTHPVEVNGRTHRLVGRVVSADENTVVVLFNGQHSLSNMRPAQLEAAR
jgi:hypothetical protein